MKKILILFLAIMPTIVNAQDDMEFTADRPGATTGPDVIAKKTLMLETGMEYESDRICGPAIKTWNYNNSLFRYGLTDFAEVRFSIAGSETYDGDGHFGGVSDLSLGTKVKIYAGSKYLPKVSLLGTLLLPGGKEHNYLSERIGGDLHLLFNNEICSWFSLGYDVGLTWIGNSGDQEETFLGFCFSFQPADKFGCFVEEYNTFAGETTCMSEVGVSYMLSPRLQIDAYTDFNLKHFGKYNNIGIGLAWKIL